MVRQSIGRGTLGGEREQAGSRREILIENLCAMLGLLFPASSQEKLQAFVNRVVDKSISLRNTMTEEQAIYRCFFPNNGDPFDRSIAQTASGEQSTGGVLICVFPGLRRLTVSEDHKKEFVSVVKAVVKLEGEFGEITTSKKEALESVESTKDEDGVAVEDAKS